MLQTEVRWTGHSPPAPNSETGLLQTDACLTSRANGEFRRSAYAGLRSLQARVQEGVVRIEGSVPTYFLKQMAQSLLQQVCGPEASIDNRVKVVGRKPRRTTLPRSHLGSGQQIRRIPR
jgi:hypothetical protein